MWCGPNNVPLLAEGALPPTFPRRASGFVYTSCPAAGAQPCKFAFQWLVARAFGCRKAFPFHFSSSTSFQLALEDRDKAALAYSRRPHFPPFAETTRFLDSIPLPFMTHPRAYLRYPQETGNRRAYHPPSTRQFPSRPHWSSNPFAVPVSVEAVPGSIPLDAQVYGAFGQPLPRSSAQAPQRIHPQHPLAQLSTPQSGFGNRDAGAQPCSSDTRHANAFSFDLILTDEPNSRVSNLPFLILSFLKMLTCLLYTSPSPRD